MAGMQGSEHPDSPCQSTLQHRLGRILDRLSLRTLEETFRTQGRHEDLNRLKDLQHPLVSHDWLWALNPNHGIKITPDEFAKRLKVRLGSR